MSEEPHMLVDVVEDNILVATFNRPEKLNAMSFELMHILDEAVDCAFATAPKRSRSC